MDFPRIAKAAIRGLITGVAYRFFANDFIAQINALIADQHRWPGNQLADFVLAFVAKRAA